MHSGLYESLRESGECRYRTIPRRIYIVETAAEFVNLCAGYNYFAVDVETRGGTITSISFSPSRNVAIVIPFTNG
jgi:hypothetical protein